MWRDQQAPEKYNAGDRLRGQVECGQVITDQQPDEPEIAGPDQRPAGEDPDHQLLQRQQPDLPGGSARLRLHEDRQRGQG